MASSKPSSAQTQADLPVLIIGAGLAGLTVALHMAESQPVILMAKRGLGEGATAWAQGGIVGVVDKEHDSIEMGGGLPRHLGGDACVGTRRDRHEHHRQYVPRQTACGRW